MIKNIPNSWSYCDFKLKYNDSPIEKTSAKGAQLCLPIGLSNALDFRAAACGTSYTALHVSDNKITLKVKENKK